MPVRTERWPAGTPCWLDIATTDLEAAKALYAELFGWTYTDTSPDYGGYLIAQKDGQATAGLGPVMMEGMSPAWTTYLASDSADDTAKAITDAGGTVLAGPMDIPGSGRMLVAVDDQGAAFGVWEAAEMVGAGLYNEPGSLVWNEAALPDPDRGRQFYAAVFGYTYETTEGAGGHYRTFHRGEAPLGGIGGLGDRPDATPPSWLAYVAVDDADRVVEATTRHGGRALGEPVDTPYGRMAVLADAQGAVFAVMGMPAQ